MKSTQGHAANYTSTCDDKPFHSLRRDSTDPCTLPHKRVPRPGQEQTPGLDRAYGEVGRHSAFGGRLHPHWPPTGHPLAIRTGHPLAIRTGHPLASRLHVACRAHSTKNCECQTTSKRFDEAEDETATVARGHTHRRRQALRWRRYQMKAPTCEEKVAARRGAAASVCTDRGGSGVRSVRARAGTHAGSSRGARRGGAAKGCAPVLHGH